jgi:hypothetical protein
MKALGAVSVGVVLVLTFLVLPVAVNSAWAASACMSCLDQAKAEHESCLARYRGEYSALASAGREMCITVYHQCNNLCGGDGAPPAAGKRAIVMPRGYCSRHPGDCW